MLSFFRELCRFPISQRWWIRIGGWSLVGLAAGWLVSTLLPAPYTSEATVRLVPPMVSLDLLPHDTIDLEKLIDRERPIVLSRNVLTTIVNNFDLYPGERRREPMEDVVEGFRKSVRMELSGPKLILVAFTYPDRLLANKVTQDLVSRLISHNIGEESNAALESFQFFKDEAETLGKSWLQSSAIVKATPPSDPRYDLLVLERDQQRKEYESVAQKLGAIQLLKDLASRGQDVRLEMLDAASLPQEPDTPPLLVWLIGLGCGLAVGLFSILWQSLHRTPPGFSVPGAEEPA